jgi:glycosyltransferase involved in cell wall biosynthesis
MILRNMVPEPRIQMSFLVPVKNISAHFETLKVQIEANLIQGDQVIVVDDYSLDGTSNLLQEWSRANTSVQVIQNRGESGLIPSLNLGLANATNDWVARFDADDLYSPNRLLKQSALISEGVVAIFSDYEFISESGRTLGMVQSAIYPEQTSLSLVMGNRTAHPSVIFNRDAVLEAGAYRAQDYLAEDLSLWLRISRLGQLRSVPEKLLTYRLNSGSVTVSSRALSKKMRESILGEIGINPIDIQKSINNLEEMQDMYETDSAGAIREFLFLRDVDRAIQISGYNSGRKTEKSLAKNLIISLIKSSPILVKAGVEKARRDIYRRSFLISKH